MVLLDRSALLDRVGWGIDHRLAVHLEQRSQSVFDVAISREPGLPPLLAASLYRPDSTGTR